jgi:hypothetical protein
LPVPIDIFSGMGGSLANLPWSTCKAEPVCAGDHDLFWGNGSYGCHPNANGYAVLSQIVYKALSTKR